MSCGGPRAARAGSRAASIGVVGAAGAVGLWVLTTSTSSFPYSGGFFLIGLAVAGIILASVAAPRSIVPRVLSLSPVRYVGRISYGLYIWHWPIFIWLDHSRTGLYGYELFGLRVLVTFAVAVVSFHLIERPDPHGHLRQPVEGVAGRARRRGRRHRRHRRGDHRDDRGREHGVPVGHPRRRWPVGHDVDRARCGPDGDAGAGPPLRGLGGADARDRIVVPGGPGQVRLRPLRQGHPRLRCGRRARGRAHGRP